LFYVVVTEWLLLDSDGFEFMVVSLDNSTWHFEAQSQEVRLIWDFCEQEI